MKKIALFGASGLTGQLVLQKLLASGYTIQALVRTPEKIQEKNLSLKVIKGDVLNKADVENTVKGCDVIISLFGHVKNSPEWLQTNGTINIAEAMKKNNIQKIISISGGGLPYPQKDEPKFADKLIRTIMKIVVPKILNDAIKHAEILKNSNLNWIIARAPRLNNNPAIGTYRVGWVGVNASTKISRADFADFILTQIEDNSFLKQMPFVSN